VKTCQAATFLSSTISTLFSLAFSSLPENPFPSPTYGGGGAPDEDEAAAPGKDVLASADKNGFVE